MQLLGERWPEHEDGVIRDGNRGHHQQQDYDPAVGSGRLRKHASAPQEHGADGNGVNRLEAGVVVLIPVLQGRASMKLRHGTSSIYQFSHLSSTFSQVTGTT